MALSAVLCAVAGYASVPKGAVLEDFDTFVNLLEETHPDPYTAFGGRPFFHKRVSEMRSDLEAMDSVSPTVLSDSLSVLTSVLCDGHTSLIRPQNDNVADEFFMVKFRQIPEGLIVSGVERGNERFLGSLAVGTNGMPIEEVARRVSCVSSAENASGRMNLLSKWYHNRELYNRVFGSVGDSLKVEVVLPSGAKDSFSVRSRTREEFNQTDRVNLPSKASFPKGHLEYSAVSDSVMVYRIKSIMAREDFTYQYENGWDFYGSLEYMYRNVLNRDMPADTLTAVRALPSFSEESRRMLEEMKKKGMSTLIIDLRGNEGGWTPIVHPFLYSMYGDSLIADQSQNDWFARRISPLYMKKIAGTLEEFNRDNGTNLDYGDFLFSDPAPEDMPLDTLRQYFLGSLMASPEIVGQLLNQHGEPFYRPERVYVVTDGDTFSAAFHLAFYLWQMGAKIVGITSGQAANSFMESTPFTLPNTGIQGSISNSIQVMLPPAHPYAKSLTPELSPEYSDYVRYGFDNDSELMYLIDNL